MPDYTQAKIYQIVDLTNDDVYIGSTTQTLNCRLSEHVSCFKSYKNGKKNYITSFKIIENGTYKIELIEDFPCDNKHELLSREGHFIKERNCINKYIAGRSIKESNKQWWLKNPNYLNDYRKTWEININCECGGRYTSRNKAQHFKTKKHLNM